MDQGLEILADKSGAVVLGWLAEDVLYLNFVGRISGSIGEKCAARLKRLLARRPSVHCFWNAAAARAVDFSARTAVVLAFVEHRHCFRSIVVLGESPAIRATAGAVAAVLDNVVSPAPNGEAFDRQLLAAAPLGRLKLRELELTSLQGSVRWRGSSVPSHV